MIKGPQSMKQYKKKNYTSIEFNNHLYSFQNILETLTIPTGL